MQPTRFGHDGLTRLEVQVIGVGQHHLGAGGRQLGRCHPLTVPSVPTGMKRGVLMKPWGV
jgi:hypothetical protein